MNGGSFPAFVVFDAGGNVLFHTSSNSGKYRVPDDNYGVTAVDNMIVYGNLNQSVFSIIGFPVSPETRYESISWVTKATIISPTVA